METGPATVILIGHRLVIIALLLLAPISARTAPLADSDPLQDAWERAREASSYKFTTDVEQNLIPRPIPEMIGQTDERVDMRIEGQVTLPDQVRMEIRFEGGGLDVPPLALVRDGPETYLLKEGERVPVENPVGLASPTSDYLSYLAAAENVRECESANQRVSESASQRISKLAMLMTSKVELLWMARMSMDQQVTDRYGNTSIETSVKPLHTYLEESFRVTGLQITKSPTLRA